MSRDTIIAKLSTHKVSYFVLIIILVSLNLTIAYVMTTYADDIPQIANFTPFGDIFGPISASLVVGLITLGIWRMRLLVLFPIISSLIIAGIWSNYLEYVLVNRNYVIDYIPFMFGYINLADIQIWTGVLLLSYMIWIYPIISKQKPNKVHF